MGSKNQSIMDYLNTQDVMRKLNVSKMTISRMVKNGYLKPVYKETRFFLFDAKEIECLTYKKHSKCNK